jgi:hypothetical protein
MRRSLLIAMMMAAVVLGAAPSRTIAAGGAVVDQLPGQIPVVDQAVPVVDPVAPVGDQLPPDPTAPVLDQAAAQLPAPRLDPPTTIVGQLVEANCYRQRGAAATAPEHLKCATMCAQKGARLAVVTSTGDVFLVTGILTQDNNAKLIPLVQRMVVLTGTMTKLQPMTASAAPILVDPKADARRLNGTEGGVIEKTPTKTADFREGDATDGPALAIDAVTADLAPVKAQ